MGGGGRGDRVFRSKTLEIGVEESEERGRQERRGGGWGGRVLETTAQRTRRQK